MAKRRRVTVLNVHRYRGDDFYDGEGNYSPTSGLAMMSEKRRRQIGWDSGCPQQKKADGKKGSDRVQPMGSDTGETEGKDNA